MKKKPISRLRDAKQDAEFGFDLTPDIIDGINTMRHADRSNAVTQQTHKTPRNNTRLISDS